MTQKVGEVDAPDFIPDTQGAADADTGDWLSESILQERIEKGQKNAQDTIIEILGETVEDDPSVRGPSSIENMSGQQARGLANSLERIENNHNLNKSIDNPNISPEAVEAYKKTGKQEGLTLQQTANSLDRINQQRIAQTASSLIVKSREEGNNLGACLRMKRVKHICKLRMTIRTQGSWEAKQTI